MIIEALVVVDICAHFLKQDDVVKPVGASVTTSENCGTGMTVNSSYRWDIFALRLDAKILVAAYVEPGDQSCGEVSHMTCA